MVEQILENKALDTARFVRFVSVPTGHEYCYCPRCGYAVVVIQAEKHWCPFCSTEVESVLMETTG